MSEDYNIQDVASAQGDGGMANALELLRRTVEEQGKYIDGLAQELQNQQKEIGGLLELLRTLLAERATANQTLGLAQDTIDILGRNLSDVWPLKPTDADDGDGQPGMLRIVPVTKEDGLPGDASTQCSYTYTFTVDGVTYTGVALSSNGNRDLVGAMNPGNFALIQKEDDAWKIYDVDETHVKSICASGA